jgi:hypothetical protein
MMRPGPAEVGREARASKFSEARFPHPITAKRGLEQIYA